MMAKTTGLSAGRPSASKAKLSMADEVELSRINAQVTSDEHQKLKMYCVKNKTSITDLVRKMIAALPE
ncbi:MAG: plasmid partition protein ParG [Gammaproteobacteria bacterium]